MSQHQLPTARTRGLRRGVGSLALALAIVGTLALSVAPAHAAVVDGTEQGDVLDGTSADDVIKGLGGGDIINARNGDDTILGGNGSDRIRAGRGADAVYAGNGSDIVKGGPGADVLHPQKGTDVVKAGPGDDAIYLQNDKRLDQIFCGKGTDTLYYPEGEWDFDDEFSDCEVYVAVADITDYQG
ncbi:hypothetical protein [Nocardioides sp.]|uniref:calcium-binding protein n=1 Tax=Nocardioides sp. TaxID=35761 RepID=UPI00321C2C44